MSTFNTRTTQVERILYGGWRPVLTLSLLGAAPIATAVWADVFSPTAEFSGYSSAYHWLSWPLLLPGILIIVRLVWQRVVPRDLLTAPVISLFPAAHQQQAASRLRHFTTGSRAVALLAVGLAIALSLLDAREQIGCAVGLLWHDESCVPSEKDWSVMFMEPSHRASLNQILAHDLAAYTAQGAGIGLALLLFLLCLQHNAFFILSVYQRVRHCHSSGPFIIVDFDDKAECFGFKDAFRAFNTQVWTLTVAGGVFLLSRWANVPQDQLGGVVAALLEGDLNEFRTASAAVELFRDFGQIMIVAGWLAMSAVVLSPVIVKFLPLLPPSPQWQESQYLAEYCPPPPTHLASADVDRLKARFRRSHFWPNGDPRARVLFLFAVFMLLWLIVPVQPSASFGFFLFAGVLISVAVGVVAVLFAVLRSVLAMVSRDLVSR